LWHATVPCLALAILLASVMLLPTTPTATVTTSAPTVASEDLSTVFEETLLASSDQLTSYDLLEETW
jgi:hypothetical protein